MTVQEVLSDAGALGGLAFYLVCVLALAAAGQTWIAACLTGLLLVAYAVLVPLRLLFHRVRPDRQKYKSFLQRIDASSFPSTHAMRAAILASFFSVFFFDEFGSVILPILAMAAAALVGWTRVHFKRHYWSDVIVGWVLGVILVIGLFIAL